MKWSILIWPLAFITWLLPRTLRAQGELVSFTFLGEKVDFQVEQSFSIPFDADFSAQSIQDFQHLAERSGYKPVVEKLLAFRDQYKLDDWLYYQLIRKTAQQFSPKGDNYPRYTLYKWFLLVKSGYNSLVTISNQGKILFYIKTDEKVYNIPFRIKQGQQFVCLNYHDYGQIDFQAEPFSEVALDLKGAEKGFTYKVTRIPELDPDLYTEKDINFNYYQEGYHFKVKLNPDIKSLFNNYPVLDYANYFNTPMSETTYSTLIPELKKAVKGLSTKKGVEFLMNFTRYAFLYEPDIDLYGGEKRFTPEQTLLSESSDCDDRSALFFYLVKEIYDLPMLVLSYPTHVTVAVAFQKPVGPETIEYGGKKYTICEPTPQKTDLKMGQAPPQLKTVPFEIAYVYHPGE